MSDGDFADDAWLLKENDRLIIRVPEHCRDNSWANHIGDIQSAIEVLADPSTADSKKIVVDFLECRWIDPMPLMSMLLEISYAISVGLQVEVRLPPPDDGPGQQEAGPYQNSSNRLLRFMNEEGFLDCLDAQSVSGRPNADDREQYRVMNVRPSYEDARCIPMTLLMLENEEREFAKREVERILSGVETRLNSRIASRASEQLIYKLRVLLQELIHNAQEHAYEKYEKSRQLAIYVRYRTGRLGLDTAGTKTFDDNILEESNGCEGLPCEWISNRTGCLEVFVLDRGMGMVRSYENGGKKLSYKFKFDQVLKETYLEGKSSRHERETAYGGLHLLHNLLKETGDYIRGLEDGVWVHAMVPLERNSQTHKLVESRKTKKTLMMRGLAMHYRLGWKAETDHGDKWAEFSEDGKEALWSELRLSESDCAQWFEWFDTKLVIDEKFGSYELSNDEIDNDWILWLVRPHKMKNDILSYLERQVAPLAKEGAILVIADIPSYEAETYAAAISEFKTRRMVNWPSKFAKIYLCTNRWRFATTSYARGQDYHGFDSLVTDFSSWQSDLQKSADEPKNFRLPKKLANKPGNFRLAVVRWMKWYQSKKIWEVIAENEGIFISKPVRWGFNEDGKSSRNIEGYLDFARSARNPLCAEIYRASLARVLGILPPDQVSMYPMDLLTTTVLSDINAQEVYEPAKGAPETKLAIGSVLVSGATKNSAVTTDRELYFFVHGSSPLKGDRCALLYWFPTTSDKQAHDDLMRIGKTATIARLGWQSFEVPRFDDDGRPIGGRDPESTYVDWQNSYPLILKMGHWSYQGHHDFVTINIPSAVDAAFLEKNDLARFLVGRIMPFIGIIRSHLREDYRRLLDDTTTNSSSLTDTVGNGLLVYRSHPSTESIIRRLLEALTPQGLELALPRIFPILPVRMRSSGSTMLIPPLSREEIRAAIHMKSGPRPVMIFDDAAITGRTLQDLGAALVATGARKIVPLVIVNRLRQPSNSSGDQTLDYYWRLDVPVMGRTGNCPLCHATNLAKEFARVLSSEKEVNEVNGWTSSWEASSILHNWNRGLRPIRLESPEIRKNYCSKLKDDGIKISVTFLANIDIIRSTGLVVNISELHAMTGRDDYFLKKASQHKEPEVRLEIAASQLFLFGYELDMEVRVKLIGILIRELPKIQQAPDYQKKDHVRSEHAKLASLAVLLGVGMLDDAVKRQAITGVHDLGWLEAGNQCCRILLAYFAKSGLLDPASEAYKSGKRLLSTEQLPLADRLREIYLETLSPLGNPHSEAIPRLLEDLREGKTPTLRRLQDAMQSLAHLEDLIGPLDRSLIRKDARIDYDQKLKMWAKKSKVAMLRIERAETEITGMDKRKIAKTFSTYLGSIKSVADAYFYRFENVKIVSKKDVFTDMLRERIIKKISWSHAVAEKDLNKGDRIVLISTSGSFAFHKSAYEIWFAWYEGISHAVEFFIQNAIHASGRICDPWDQYSNASADMWVRVDFFEKQVVMSFVNESRTLPHEAWTEISKRKFRWSALDEIGGQVGLFQPPGELSERGLGIQFIVPYAGFLRSAKGDRT